MRVLPAYDVVVIGAGPAGSVAARATAEAGLSTLLVEKRQEIGSPVRCGEAVGRDTVARFIPLDATWIAAEVDTFSLSNPRGDCVVLPPLEKTLVLERRIFDRELARLAAQAGAHVLVKTRAAGFTRLDTGALRVDLVMQGEPRVVEARIVIGADGVEGQSARWAGLNPVPSLRHYFSAAQYLMAGIDVDPRICQYHLGWSIAPSGYAWVFPKRNRTANVGLVMIQEPGNSGRPIDYLDQFIAARFPKGAVLAQITGGIPITNVLPRMVADGYLAAGDAAHQADPLTGGGITNGMHGGLFAAQTAIEALKHNDTSARFLSQYERRWDAEFGGWYRRLMRIRQAIVTIPEERLSRMIAEASRLNTRHFSPRDLAGIMLKEQPRLLIDMLELLLGM